jgi:hypothetical protein
VRGRYVVLFLLVVLLSSLNYARSLDNSFFSDDYFYLDMASGPDPLKTALTPHGRFSFYRPGLLVLFYAEFVALQWEPGLYIVVNYLIHALNSALLLGLLMRLGFRRTPSVIASMLFLFGCCHYGKQIMWACSVGTLFSQTLMLTGLLLGVLWLAPGAGDRERPNPARRLLPLAVTMLFCIAPFFHESALIGPVLMLFILLIFKGKRWQDCLRPGLLMLAPIAIWGAVLVLVYRNYPAYSSQPDDVLSTLDRLVRYIGFMLVPVKTSTNEALKPFMSGTVLRLVGGAHYVIGFAFLGLLAWTVRRRNWLYAFLFFWIPVGLLPFSAVGSAGARLELRYLYAAAMPMCALFASLIGLLLSRRRAAARRLAGVLVGCAVAGTLALVQVIEITIDMQCRNRSKLNVPPEIIERVEQRRAAQD